MSALREILGNSQYWGLTLSIGAYLFACWLKQKTKLAFLNPILVSVIVIRSEEHTSELQSLLAISYAVFCLKKKKFF